MNKIILVTGGIKSGKSQFAIDQVLKKKQPVSYIVTGLPSDSEMKRRIQKHMQTRPSAWQTIEEPTDLISAFIKVKHNIIILDCINFWTANMLGRYVEKEIILSLEKICLSIKNRKSWLCYIVSNEVGLSLVSAYKSGRVFQDVLGKINQIIAKKYADEVYFMVSGIPLKIK